MTNETQRTWDEILHTANPSILWGTKRLEWSDVLNLGIFAPIVNAIYRLVETLDHNARETVICAALRTEDGRIARGHRHHNCFLVLQGWEQAGNYVRDKQEEEQGFITSRNRFVSREEGLALQQAAGIPSADPERNGDYHPRHLFSEDLY